MKEIALTILMCKNLNPGWLTTLSPTMEDSESTIVEPSLPETILSAVEIGGFSVPILAYGGVAILGIWAATALIKALTDLVKACQD